jgi:AhpD family alkylhydroperoxidase
VTVRSAGVVSLVPREQAPLLARAFYGDGRPSPITRSLAHVPELLEVTAPFVGRALSPGVLDARTTEIAIVRASAQLGCRYCVQTHSVAALDAGLSRAEVQALRGERSLGDAFAGPAERALIAYVDAVATGRGPVAAEERAPVEELLGDPGLVALTLLVGATVMLNRYCSVLELPTGSQTLERLAAEGLA